ncbi:MAG: hypothetical protein QOI47_1452, partial [Actinomycetota bacterium]|nr:hypothetical protein [Actinomycetota bacterium]
MHRHTKAVVAGAVVLLTLTGVAGPAFAAGGTPGTPTIVPVVQPTAGHETVKPNAKDASKGRAAAEIARRQRTLSALSAKVARVTADCGENAALVAELAAESAGLAALGHTIANETDTSKLKAEYASIFQDYRVYLLETPKTHTVVACDRVTENSTKITAWIAKAQSAIDKAAAAGADVGGAQTALDAV